MKQQTLAKEISFSGVGLHTGAETSVSVKPAESGTGFVLCVGDKKTALRPELGNGEKNCTCIQVDGEPVHTIEHLMGALWGMGVDNAEICVTGGEIPGMDGSARPFTDAVAEAGLIEQDAECAVFIPKEPVTVSAGDACITAFPSADGSFKVTYVLDYPQSKLAQGTAEFVVTPESIRESISPCRTFVMKEIAEAMLKMGLGKGANTTNTIVLDGDKVVDNELRFDDECVRHKILDVIGDLATVGRRLGVHVVAFKSGHTLNLEMAKALRKAIHYAEHPSGVMDIREIENTLPHRYPFLLVDRVLELEPYKRIVTIKNVTRNEEFFNGHFPGQPIMPGVLQIEALAQSGGIAMMEDKSSKLAVLMSIDNVKFRRPVVPGDQVRMEVVFEKFKGRIGVVNAQGSVDGEPTASCMIKFALVDVNSYT